MTLKSNQTSNKQARKGKERKKAKKASNLSGRRRDKQGLKTEFMVDSTFKKKPKPEEKPNQ